MKVVLTRSAEADPEAIVDWIAKDSPRRALTFIRELRTRCMALGEHPRAFPLVPRYETHGIRRRVYGNYLIFYRIEETQVTILHVLHGARDYEPLLFPEF
ncbi:MAG TPA: type II toxin-antitoxin system RelE/ParE family toxin [Caulobacteraceae bacterium]|nr:type II toxin-antitoxin system RelE/ParE family toxin [Caulobacteraceae bacterium]